MDRADYEKIELMREVSYWEENTTSVFEKVRNREVKTIYEK
jgi:hypothetical protein